MARFAQAARDVAAGLGVIFDQENTHVRILPLRSLVRNQVKKTSRGNTPAGNGTSQITLSLQQHNVGYPCAVPAAEQACPLTSFFSLLPLRLLAR